MTSIRAFLFHWGTTIFVAFALLVGLRLFGEEKPSTPAPLPEVSKLRLLSAYKSALLKQEAITKAQADFQASVAAYQAAAAQVIRDAGLPADTTFEVNSDANTVEIKMPPPKPAEAKKDDTKK